LTALRDVPRLLAACALFIGCDSGPKHIAAASGVATIGIHSGIVDPAEWGPMGPRAVALYRDMSCSPCFLAKPEHCPRGLACVEMLDPSLVWQMARRFLGRPVTDRIASGRRALPVPDAVAVPPAQLTVVVELETAELELLPDPAETEIVVPQSAKRRITPPSQVLAKRPAKQARATPEAGRSDGRSGGRVQRNPVAGPK
jgi:hypothetical protein